jgi:hypothetical protein
MTERCQWRVEFVNYIFCLYIHHIVQQCLATFSKCVLDLVSRSSSQEAFQSHVAYCYRIVKVLAQTPGKKQPNAFIPNALAR